MDGGGEGGPEAELRGPGGALISSAHSHDGWKGPPDLRGAGELARD